MPEPTPDPRILALAKARQQVAHENTNKSLPQWDGLSKGARDVHLLEAAAWVRAAITAGIIPAAADDFTDARAAFMNIGRTPSLEGLRTELRIEGRPVLVGRYCGAEMGRMHDVPGYEHVLSIKPQLLFEYDESTAAEQPAESCGKCRQPFDPADTRSVGTARHRDTAYCRGCVTRCHDTEIADHRCVICA
ncbi:hypothetical protein ACIRQH_19930 [Streptomyces sp. NPDC102279]|uniref:hypothetical protein n=1 Tax=Streptomyces sp. NPDC102279 TaxID=3366153 RepID=UPI003809167A